MRRKVEEDKRVKMKKVEIREMKTRKVWENSDDQERVRRRKKWDSFKNVNFRN